MTHYIFSLIFPGSMEKETSRVRIWLGCCRLWTRGGNCSVIYILLLCCGSLPLAKILAQKIDKLLD